MILSGYLRGQYGRHAPVSLNATLTFEQTYESVDGDSASSTELYALLSALSGVPVDQGIAVTGSVDQFGRVQAVGGVTRKIEGFFDICQARGLTGAQGVLIPTSNVQHLMLRQDVIDACKAGRFAVYPIANINAGIALLTGIAAGEREPGGDYPLGSINRRVEERLRSFASIRRSFGRLDESRATGG